ncbi:hypothetical protein COO60DRAFT_1633214 [Scenedesmus sp. NREL 46B-D3]|nr:hypothetical protein COO60DRAFT_1633214 [Scenedesmus sp. NREL 46B-D3]
MSAGGASLSPPAAAVAATADHTAVEVPAVPLSFADRPGLLDAEGRLMLKNLTLEELQEWCEAAGHGSKRASQLWRAIYGDKSWIRSMDDADASAHRFAAAFKAVVAQGASLAGGLSLQSASTARDGTHKLVFAVHGGPGGNVETVLIPMHNRDGSQLRYTACLSSQVGCAMNCQFCYTGRMGLLGNLTTAQMVEQLVEARRWLAQYSQQQQQQQQQQTEEVLLQGGSQQQQQQQEDAQWQQLATAPPRINNIVFMGMGEPLHNMSALMPALDIICHPQGLALSRSKVIVSTVGLVPQLRQLRASGKAKLAVSLHATTDEVRSWIVPTNRKHPLDELIGALRELSSSSSSSSTRRSAKSDDFVVIEYVLLKDVNDTEEDARRLLDLLADVYCMVNLIVFNPHEGTRFQRSDDEQVKRFRQVLMQGGKVCTLRMSKGDDEMAACGQLGNPELAPRPAPLLRPPAQLRESLPGAAAAAEAAELQRRQLGARQR